MSAENKIRLSETADYLVFLGSFRSWYRACVFHSQIDISIFSYWSLPMLLSSDVIDLIGSLQHQYTAFLLGNRVFLNPRLLNIQISNRNVL